MLKYNNAGGNIRKRKRTSMENCHNRSFEIQTKQNPSPNEKTNKRLSFPFELIGNSIEYQPPLKKRKFNDDLLNVQSNHNETISAVSPLDTVDFEPLYTSLLDEMETKYSTCYRSDLENDFFCGSTFEQSPNISIGYLNNEELYHNQLVTHYDTDYGEQFQIHQLMKSTKIINQNLKDLEYINYDNDKEVELYSSTNLLSHNMNINNNYIETECGDLYISQPITNTKTNISQTKYTELNKENFPSRLSLISLSTISSLPNGIIPPIPVAPVPTFTPLLFQYQPLNTNNP